MVLYDAWNAQMMEAMETVQVETIPMNNKGKLQACSPQLIAWHIGSCLTNKERSTANTFQIKISMHKQPT